MMGQYMKLWTVVATWVWWNAVVGQAQISPLMVGEHEHTLDYPTVSFTTQGATKDSYSQFIEALRDQLASGETSHGIPKMRKPSEVPKFLLVELSNLAADQSPVTLAVNMANADAVAYRTGDRSFFLNETDPNLFTDTKKHTFPFSGKYIDLTRAAKNSRENISLGMKPFEDGISSLQISNMDDQSLLAHSLIVVIQMVAESVRFKHIEHRVRESIVEAEPFQPDPAMISLENNWRLLSMAVQNSNEGGVFSIEVVLYKRSNDTLIVGSANDQVMAGLAIMMFVCSKGHYFIDHLLMVGPAAAVVEVATDFVGADTCEAPELTVRIRGRNGLCVAVSEEKYDDGNPIVLLQCEEQLVTSQLWTFKNDQTIQSNGKCLTTPGSNPGDSVTIYSCTTATPGSTHWQLWDNGTFINLESALALSAESGESGSPLTVETSIYASRQCWQTGNGTETYVAPIAVLDDLCMEAEGDALVLETCDDSKEEQNWAFYADGSIRPEQNQDSCLTSDENHSEGSIIIISSCDPGSERQRWRFMNDGRILNLNNGLVMQPDPSNNEIIIMPFTGARNQKWLPLF